MCRRAVLHNLRYDETLAQFGNASGVGTNADLFLTGSAAQAARLAAAGACTAISFRTGAPRACVCVCVTRLPCGCEDGWVAGFPC